METNLWEGRYLRGVVCVKCIIGRVLQVLWNDTAKKDTINLVVLCFRLISKPISNQSKGVGQSSLTRQKSRE
jgi:hypothetical protein